MARLFLILSLSAIIASVSPLSAQMTLVHETTASGAQSAYLDKLDTTLQDVGLSSGLKSALVRHGDVEDFLEKGGVEFGIVYLDKQVSEGRNAAAGTVRAKSVEAGRASN